MSLLKTLLLSLLLAVLANGGVRFRGSCPDRSLDPNLDLEQAMGDWYVYMRWYEAHVKPPVICRNESYFNLGDDGSFNYTVYDERLGKRVDSGKFIQNATAPGLLIFYSDYDHYAIFYLCIQMPTTYDNGTKGHKNLQNMLVVTRERSPGQNVDDIIIRDIKKLNFTTDFLRKVDKTNCTEPMTVGDDNVTVTMGA